MGRKLGILAGAGAFPRLAAARARREGERVVVAAVRGEADPAFAAAADVLEWIEAGDLARTLAFFKREGVNELLLAGKIDPRVLVLRPDGLDAAARELVGRLADLGPASVLSVLVGFLSSQGIRVLDPTPYLKDFFCAPGVLTRTNPSEDILGDIAFARPKARVLADLDVGQTVAVKNRLVVAVEGVDGTDRTILRAGELAGPGIVAVKVARTRQDPRLDLPAVGLETIRSLVRARGRALWYEAAAMPFFEREESVALADGSGIVVVAG